MLVKYFIALITNELHLRDEVLKPLSAKLGAPDFISDWFDFAQTNYYEAELGRDLKRSFVSFSNLLPPEELAGVKELTTRVEDELGIGNWEVRTPNSDTGIGLPTPLNQPPKNRRINIDPGYIDHFKIVLASHKFAGHRIAIGKGYWAEVTMMYMDGKWTPMPWCYPDFRSGVYDSVLVKIRRLYKSQTSNFKI